MCSSDLGKRAENAQKTSSKTRNLGIEGGKSKENAQKAASGAGSLGIRAGKVRKMPKKQRQRQEIWAQELEKQGKSPKGDIRSRKFGHRSRKSEKMPKNQRPEATNGGRKNENKLGTSHLLCYDRKNCRCNKLIRCREEKET